MLGIPRTHVPPPQLTCPGMSWTRPRKVVQYAPDDTPSSARRCNCIDSTVPKPESAAIRSMGRSVFSSRAQARSTRWWTSLAARPPDGSSTATAHRPGGAGPAYCGPPRWRPRCRSRRGCGDHDAVSLVERPGPVRDSDREVGVGGDLARAKRARHDLVQVAARIADRVAEQPVDDAQLERQDPWPDQHGDAMTAVTSPRPTTHTTRPSGFTSLPLPRRQSSAAS